MLQRKLLMRTLSVLMSAILCVPAIAVDSAAANLNPTPRTAVELQLQADGTIRGKVVDRQGKSLANAEVKVANRIGSAVAKTDAQGMFAIQGVNVGEYVIGIGKGTQNVRVWNAQTAPPNTAQLALLVVGDTVRGQCCGAACDGCSSCAAPPACGVGPACGAPAPACGVGPACGVPSPVCSPCDSIIPSCGGGGCDSCGGSGCGGCGGGGCGLLGGGGGFGGGGGLFGGGLAGGGGVLGASPLLIGGVVAAAIAIPLAVDDDDDDAS